MRNDIKLLVMDADGTLTDGKLYMGEHGELVKQFSIKDGYGIVNILPNAVRPDGTLGIIPAIISGRVSKILEQRCKEMKISIVYQGVNNKLQKLDELLDMLHLNYSQIAYIGDDINDLDCMKKAALSGCPKDANQEVKDISNFVSNKNGGEGAVREFIDWLVAIDIV